MAITVTSAAFENGGMIPRKYTGEGADLSPPLSWTGVPDDAVALGLICDDPDAPGKTWVHWVLFNLPASATGLPEGMATERELPTGARQGVNDFGKIGYGGPMPPPGPAHRYYFKLYALDTKLKLDAGATKAELLKAMENHILAEGQLMGKYKR